MIIYIGDLFEFTFLPIEKFVIIIRKAWINIREEKLTWSFRFFIIVFLDSAG